MFFNVRLSIQKRDEDYSLSSEVQDVARAHCNDYSDGVRDAFKAQVARKIDQMWAYVKDRETTPEDK